MSDGSGNGSGSASKPASTGETEMARQPSSKSAKQKGGGAPAKGGSILKKESSYASAAKAKAAAPAANGAKALSFADDHGDALTEENFVNQLHYPQMKSNGNEPKGCCTIS